MSRSTLLALAPLLALVVVACRTPGGPQTPASVPSPTPVTTAAPEPTASPSPPPTASPSPRPSPTPSPSPSPTLDPAAVAAWVQEVCAINADLVTGTQQVIEQLPEPDDPTLAQLQATNEQRRPMIESLLADTAGRLHGVEQLDGGESFHDALRAELADRLAAAGQFFDAVAAAQTIEQYDAAVLVQAAAAQEATFRTARSVLELEPAVADALAQIDDCRAFELDARGLVRGLPLPDFSRLLVDDDLAGDAWTLPAFDGGTAAQAGGVIEFTFDGQADRQLAAPPGLQSPGGAVRVEAEMALEGLAFSGLHCLASSDSGYAAQLTGTGVLLLLRRDGDEQTTLARRVLESAPSGPITLALACAQGASGDIDLAADIDGQRMVEYSDVLPPAGVAGSAGLIAHTLGVGESATVFLRVRVFATAE